MDASFTKIRSSAIDGRLHNVIYRKAQLKKVHDALTKERDGLGAATAADRRYSDVEIRLELQLALQALRNHYFSLDERQELNDEAAVARGQDNAKHRSPNGIVLINPTCHTYLFSAISALSAAIAAGNCVILQVRQTTQRIPAALARILSGALDSEIFCLASDNIQGADIASRMQRVDQESGEKVNTGLHLFSPYQGRAIAVVERDADIEQAAAILAVARFAFDGTSPYAPDLVLVNEWVLREFLDCSSRFSCRYEGTTQAHSNPIEANKGKPKTTQPLSNLVTFLKGIEKDNDILVEWSGKSGAIVNVQKRQSSLLLRKIGAPCLIVHAITSMDDAIDFVNLDSDLLSAFHFGSAAHARYLAQFIHARDTFVNHIPAEILLGPAAPLGKKLNLKERYPTKWLSMPSAQYVNQSISSKEVSSCLQLQIYPAILLSDKDMEESLPEVKRPAKAAAFGFFEQGIMIGGGLFVSSLLIVLSTSTFYGSRAVIGWLR